MAKPTVTGHNNIDSSITHYWGFNLNSLAQNKIFYATTNILLKYHRELKTDGVFRCQTKNISGNVKD